MQADTALTALVDALREAVERSPQTARGLSERLGRHPGYLTRVLTGRLRLKVEETFALIELLGLEPHAFLELVFPYGGEEAERARARGSALPFRAGRPGLRELVERAQAEEGWLPPEPPELTARAGRVLRLALRRRGLTQRAVSRRLGLSQDVLGLALRGNTRLTFWHVFATLEAVGMSPQRFFAELFGPDDSDLTAGLRWTHWLDALEPLAGEAAAGMLEREGGEGGREPFEGTAQSRRGKGGGEDTDDSEDGNSPAGGNGRGGGGRRGQG